MKDDWKRTLVSPASTLQETLRALDAGGLQIAVVVDDEQHLLGTVTDGDIRRGILRGLELSAAVSQVMNPSPTSVPAATLAADVATLMRLRQIHHVPVVDTSNRLVGLYTHDELLMARRRENWVVLMAGGRKSAGHRIFQESRFA